MSLKKNMEGNVIVNESATLTGHLEEILWTADYESINNKSIFITIKQYKTSIFFIMVECIIKKNKYSEKIIHKYYKGFNREDDNVLFSHPYEKCNSLAAQSYSEYVIHRKK